ncbi:MAG: DNA-3-methyladenine glycosylase [Candidatus Saccharimonadales bacterium]
MFLAEVTLRSGQKHLAQVDSKLALVIAKTGKCPIQPHHNYYQELVESIISQQLSTKAAASIEKRFCALFEGSSFPTPKQILSKNPEELRTAGLSRPKIGYIQDLAQKVLDGTVQFEHLDALGNEAIIAELTQIKGVGIWTVHMFLIFCMGRLDVLAWGDLGIRNGIKKLYNLKEPPDQPTIEQLAVQNHWHPYASIACWYIWRSLDNTPKI